MPARLQAVQISSLIYSLFQFHSSQQPFSKVPGTRNQPSHTDNSEDCFYGKHGKIHMNLSADTTDSSSHQVKKKALSVGHPKLRSSWWLREMAMVSYNISSRIRRDWIMFSGFCVWGGGVTVKCWEREEKNEKMGLHWTEKRERSDLVT